MGLWGVLFAAWAADLTVPGTHATPGAAVSAAAPGDRVLIGPGTFSGVVTVVAPGVTIEGAGPGLTILRSTGSAALRLHAADATVRGLTLDGAGVGRALRVTATGALVEDVEMVGGAGFQSNEGFTAAIVNGASATLRRVHMTDPTGDGSSTGGAHLLVEFATLDATELVIANGTARYGGAMHTHSAQVTLTDSRFYENRSEGWDAGGGAIDAHDTDLVLTRCVFEDNGATADPSYGGAILAYDGGHVLVEDSVFVRNGSVDVGGAINAYYTDVDVVNSAFVGNSSRYGGAMALFGGWNEIVDSTFHGNTAGAIGGAVNGSEVGVAIHGGLFCENSAGEGGGATAFDSAEWYVENAVYSRNAASWGAAHACFQTWGEIRFTDVLDHDVAEALDLDECTVELDHNLFAHNELAVWGGSSTVVSGWNAWWANGTDRVGVPEGPGEVYGEAPGLTSYAVGSCPSLPGLALAPGSPLIDAGDPNVLDADASRADIGAFGGVSPGFSVDLDGDGFLPGPDCDDGDAGVHPGRVDDTCDGVDDDCDGRIDEDGTAGSAWFVDADGDGFGAGAPTVSCAPPPGMVDDDDDCDDQSAGIRPGAPEVCDGVDQDCDGVPDDGVPTTSWYVDGDGDGYGAGAALLSCAPIPGRVAVPGDCADADPNRRPGAPEACDGVDNDCDGMIDEGAASVPWYRDQDGDGYGAGASTGTSCQAPNPGDVTQTGDCNDALATVHPGRPEVCDGVDQDCDGSTDEGIPTTSWYADGDGDGFGAGAAVASCAQPPGRVAAAGDCNDGNASVRPGAVETCDGVDQDCNGQIDNGVPTTNWYADGDGDGYGAGSALASCSPVPGRVAQAGDCNNAVASIRPGAPEVCDGVDQDCDGSTDEGLPTTNWYADEDGDGHGAGPALARCGQPPGTSALADDCDDLRADVHPGADETCDGADNDCDELIDDDTVVVDWFVDADVDGWGAGPPTSSCTPIAGSVQRDGDCDDANPDAFPLGSEVCDGADNDCDGDIDLGAPDATVWFADLDGDGFGDGSLPTFACDAPAASVVDATDCDDLNPASYPGNPEVCDGYDNDCNGRVDDEANDAVELMVDADLDGFGVSGTGALACPGPGVSALDGDCDDTDPDAHPGAEEVCGGGDEDCAGDGDLGATAGTSTFHVDADGDGFGDADRPEAACAAGDGLVADATDCDDAAAGVNPAAVEVWYDGVDQDCDGVDLDQDGDGFVLALDCDDEDPAVNPDGTEIPGNDVDEDCDGDLGPEPGDTDTDADTDTGGVGPVSAPAGPPMWFCSATGGSGAPVWLALGVAPWMLRRRRA